MNINSCIELLCGKKCWSIIAGEGTGSVVNLGFGDKKKRNKLLQNSELTEEQRCYYPELELMVFCAWRVLKLNTVICGWRDSNAPEGDMLNGLQLLKDKAVIDLKLSKFTHDLELILEDDISIQLFCDQTNDYDADENYTLFMNPGSCSVGLKSIVNIEK
ncbi:hypothetical protein [Zooshikella ganghwensis]|uniref:hypothetical protein n=1 Tax=Zooshikella ganghwensis TaxID=202772 RepID=UPI00047F2075|nr:hypothetical protein [Zooshikella ganghwensis]